MRRFLICFVIVIGLGSVAAEGQVEAPPEATDSPEAWVRAEMELHPGQSLIDGVNQHLTPGVQHLGEDIKDEADFIAISMKIQLIFSDLCDQAKATLELAEIALERELDDVAHQTLLEILNPALGLKNKCRREYDDGYWMLGRIGLRKLKAGEVEMGTALITSSGMLPALHDPQRADRLLLVASSYQPDARVRSRWGQTVMVRAKQRGDAQLFLPLMLSVVSPTMSEEKRRFVMEHCVEHASSAFEPFTASWVTVYARADLARLAATPDERESHLEAFRTEYENLMALISEAKPDADLASLYWNSSMVGLAIHDLDPDRAFDLTQFAVDLYSRAKNPNPKINKEIRRAHATVSAAAGKPGTGVENIEPFGDGIHFSFEAFLMEYLEHGESTPPLLMRLHGRDSSGG